MSPLETVIEELRCLPPDKLERAAAYVHALRSGSNKDGHSAIKATAGCLAGEVGESLERAIEEGCERIDPADW